MDFDDILEELDRVKKEMLAAKPGTESYNALLRNFSMLGEMLHCELESRDSQLDHEVKRKVEEATAELDALKEENRRKQTKLELWFSVVRIILTAIGAIAAIIVTGSLEQSSILSQKCFSLIRTLMPKI